MTITGYFTLVDVSEVPVGEDIKATIDFYAINPGALYWATFLVVDCPQLGLRKLLDKAREIGEEGGRKHTYTIAKMPGKNITLSFFLFAHDDAGYDWSWMEYDIWLQGYSVEITYLSSNYKFLSPVEISPPVEEPVMVVSQPFTVEYQLTPPTPPEEPPEAVLVASVPFVVKYKAVPPVPPDEEEKKFPWGPAALVAGGAVLVVTSIEKPKT